MSDVQLLRVREAATLLGCSRSQMYVLVRSGEVPAVTLGSSLRIPRVALERLIEEKLAAATGQGKPPRS